MISFSSLPEFYQKVVACQLSGDKAFAKEMWEKMSEAQQFHWLEGHRKALADNARILDAFLAKYGK